MPPEFSSAHDGCDDRCERCPLDDCAVRATDMRTDLAEREGELFRSFRRLADKVGTEPLRDALKQSFAITANASLRDEYERARKELDAFLRSENEGVSTVNEPEGFVASPEVTAEEAEEIASKLAAASKRPRH